VSTHSSDGVGKILMQSVTGYRVHGVAEMLAVGLNLERDVFTKAAVDG
jgi:hypothetical protein